MRILKFNENNKFNDTKDLISNLQGMLVDLQDKNINVIIEPKNDIQVKMLSIGRTDMLSININNFSKNDFHLIKDKIYTISDYVNKHNMFIKILYSEQTYKKRTFELESDDLYKIENKNLDWIRIVFFPLINESLPNQKSVDQLKMVMRASAKTDIGNRISDMNKQGANIDYIQNPIDSGIESYEDYEKHNKKFISSWNLKNKIGPFDPEPKPKVNLKLNYKQQQDKIK